MCIVNISTKEIQCDHEGCNNFETFDGDTDEVDILRDCVEDGWSVSNEEDTYCPDHANDVEARNAEIEAEGKSRLCDGIPDALMKFSEKK